jgi:hypothetical protein
VVSALNPYQAHRLLHAHLEPQWLHFSPSRALRLFFICAKNRPEKARHRPAFVHSNTHRKSPVGASMLAMVVNDSAGSLTPRGVLRFFASRLAPA